MSQNRSWVEQHASSAGQQLVVHLSGDDLRVLAAGVPVTVQTEPADASHVASEPPVADSPAVPSVEVLVHADRT